MGEETLLKMLTFERFNHCSLIKPLGIVMSSIIRAFNRRKFVEAVASSRLVRKYSGKLQNMMFRQTASDKRKSIFGNDPFAA